MAADSLARYDSAPLRSFMAGVAEHYGVPPADAALAAEVLAHADLSGVDTHGIANFVSHWHYAPGLRDGSVASDPLIEVLRDSPVAASWDGGHGLGPVVAHRAMSAAIDKAERTGIGMVTVRNGCHFGAQAHFAEMAAARRMIGVCMSHTAPSAAPPSGLDKVFGTNPLGVAAPVAGRHPFVLDMATTAVAGTKVQRARQRGEAIPDGWVSPTGELVPLGSTADAGGFKGYGLALVVDILSGVLSGEGSGLFHTFGPAWKVGYWMAAWRVDAFVDADEFEAEMRRMVDAIHATRPAPGHDEVLVPGDRAAAHRDERTRLGVPLDPSVVAQCRTWATETGVPFPEPIA